MKPTYLWLDTEMTGLDIEHAALLEVGAVVVSEDLDVISKFHALLHFDRDNINPNLAFIEPAVTEMHTRNGLWDACLKAKSLPVEVDRLLCIWAGGFFKPGEVILGGRSIWFDRDVAKLHLPKFHGLLHHRQMETYTLQCACERYGLPGVQSEHPHRALADALDDLRVAREQLRMLGDNKPVNWWTL